MGRSGTRSVLAVSDSVGASYRRSAAAQALTSASLQRKAAALDADAKTTALTATVAQLQVTLPQRLLAQHALPASVVSECAIGAADQPRQSDRLLEQSQKRFCPCVRADESVRPCMRA